MGELQDLQLQLEDEREWQGKFLAAAQSHTVSGGLTGHQIFQEASLLSKPAATKWTQSKG
jgi:hypothetical protein